MEVRTVRMASAIWPSGSRSPARPRSNPAAFPRRTSGGDEGEREQQATNAAERSVPNGLRAHRRRRCGRLDDELGAAILKRPGCQELLLLDEDQVVLGGDRTLAHRSAGRAPELIEPRLKMVGRGLQRRHLLRALIVDVGTADRVR